MSDIIEQLRATVCPENTGCNPLVSACQGEPS